MDTSLRLAQVAVAVEDLMVLLEHQEVMEEIGNQYLESVGNQDGGAGADKGSGEGGGGGGAGADIEEDLVELLVSMNRLHPHPIRRWRR